MRRIFIGIGVVVLLLVLIFMSYPAIRLAGLYLGSHTVQTSRGPMEIARQGEGPPVLIVHGLMGGYDQGLLFADALVKNGFEVISVSRPGYLLTPLSTGKTPEEQAQALIALLNALSIQKAVVMGISAGGPCSIDLALDHPDRVAGLILLSAVSGPLTRGQPSATQKLHRGAELHPYKWDFDALLGSISVRFNPKPALDWTLSLTLSHNPKTRQIVTETVLASPDQKALLDHMIDGVFPLSEKTKGVRNDLAQIRTMSDLPLGKIAVPTLIIHGNADRLVPYATAVAAQKSIPGSVLVTIPEGGHLVQLGPNAPEVDAALVTFCRKVSQK